MKTPELLAATLQVIHIFEKLKVPHLITGSLASTVHGLVRTTQDSDLLAALKPEHLPEFVRALKKDFYIDEQMVSAAIAQQGSFNLVHRASMFKVDVFVTQHTPFDQAQLQRAQRENLIPETSTGALVATAEDTILSKLNWYKLGGEVSERQWRDILGILKVQHDRLDKTYLHKWATELKLSTLLERALKDSETKD
jgi:hypothetical protein